ncbi:MAG: hypothetical protein Q7T54_00375, partial [Candidatus Levybacteria bacterium]|nr:hypothetical protein [Candidatus Levybacteria bacterium]
MRKSALFLIALTVLAFAYSRLPKEAYSGELGALVRLDRLTRSTTTGGTICATPESAGTETSIQVIFPTGMTVNSTASNWTIDTSDIPDGSTAMPGVTTATAVSGQAVTFPISDLSTGTQYCFKFSSTNTLTTPSSTGNYEGTLRTRNASNTTIDTRNFGIAIISNDRITVTATVPASPTDFVSLLALSNPENGYLREETTLTYTLNYGSYLTNATSITVQAGWDLGTIQGNNTPTESVLSYVVGSASNAHNNTEPVIDTVNRTISWEITSFPANTTGKSVSFKLKTYNDYTGSLLVSFAVNGRVLGPGTQTADSTVTSTYRYSAYITPTPTPTCVPSACPTPIPSATPTPTPVPKATVIDEIDVRTISSTDATISVTSNNKTKAKVLYGTSKNNLNETLSFPTLLNSHLIKLDELDAQTRYYFRIILTDEYKRVLTSDLYIIDTAAQSVPAEANIDSLIVTSNDVILTDPLRNLGNIPRIVIPQNTPYAFKFAVTNFKNVKSIQAVLRNNNVLGLSSNIAYASTQGLTITEISPGQYIGRLTTNPAGGTYELILQISDYSGNISEQLATTITVVDSLRVVSSENNQGIENAKITLFYYNERQKTFELLSSAVTPIKNPTFTEPDGTTTVVLPEGKYRAEVEVLGYKSKTVEFTISPGSSNYPLIELDSLPPDALTYLKYTLSTINDALDIFQKFLHALRTSNRFFDLTAFIGITIMSALLLISSSRRMSVPIRHLPYFALYHLLSFIKKPTDNFLVHGKVTAIGVDDVIADAIVYICLQTGKILTRVTTNVDGEFFAKINSENNLKIIVSKKGYRSTTLMVRKGSINDQHKIPLIPREKPQKMSLSALFWYISFLTGSLFESILILTLVIELLFLLEFGFWRVAPFML